ncbi:hypothetical protein [Dyella sp. C11]|uniref:hypothetical protein n=1 Tax=Dyella sp. C11 TaxID=2126991 RepID=UPI001300A000|nr:hypothetical protein [Dyella sp. C11]
MRHDQNPGVAANLPGSDRPMVHGIQLADPATQGIKPVVNWMQRHFGVPDKHCIDVDAWRMMTPQQLLDRHMSPDDVEKEAQRHRCFPRDA